MLATRSRPQASAGGSAFGEITRGGVHTLLSLAEADIQRLINEDVEASGLGLPVVVLACCWGMRAWIGERDHSQE